MLIVANIIWQHSRASLYKNWCSFKMDVPWEHLSMIQKTREGTHKFASNRNKQDISPMNMDINQIWASIISLSIYPCLLDTSNRPYGSKYEATTGHICKKTTQKTPKIFGSIGSIGHNMAFLYGIILGITWFNRQSYPAGRSLHSRPQDTHIQQFLLSLTGPQCNWLVEIAVS